MIFIIPAQGFRQRPDGVECGSEQIEHELLRLEVEKFQAVVTGKADVDPFQLRIPQGHQEQQRDDAMALAHLARQSVWGVHVSRVFFVCKPGQLGPAVPTGRQFKAANGFDLSGNRSGAVYWDIKIDAQLVSQARQALGRQILTIAGQIKSVGSFKLPPNWDGWAKLTGFTDENGPTEMNAPDGPSGQVRKRHGIVSLLFLMALRDARLEGVNIGVAGDEGIELFDLKSEELVFDL